jgi:hypothetical protein
VNLDQALADWLSAAIAGVFFSALLLPVVTAMYWRWWQTELGVNLMAFDILLAAAVSPRAVYLVFGVTPSRAAYLWLSCIVLTLIIPAVIWRAWLLWTLQRGTRSHNPVTAVRAWRKARKEEPR